jgi:hypothetical protein
MSLHQEIASSQVLSFPTVSERRKCHTQRAAEIEQMQLAVKVALDALDVLEARVSKRDALGPPATSGPGINRFASRIAEGLSRARAAG